jgi:hypothetical protein
MKEVPRVQWQYDPAHDARDGAEWTEAVVEELAIVVENGGTLLRPQSCSAGGHERGCAPKSRRVGLLV